MILLWHLQSSRMYLPSTKVFFPPTQCLMQHNIPTSGCHPARVPPRRIPAHYRAEVEKQLDEMIAQGIISQSTSSWVAPACCVCQEEDGQIKDMC